MIERNNGGTAFPTPDSSQFRGTDGMSLRDYFAAAALTGILIDRDAPACVDQANPLAEQLAYMQSAAEGAYRAADAMLWERNK